MRSRVPGLDARLCGPFVAAVDGLAVSWTGNGLVDYMMRGLSQAVDGKEVQCRKCQNGRDGDAYTHHDFGGAERQSIFYTNAPSETG